jgi:hypothetical protein
MIGKRIGSANGETRIALAPAELLRSIKFWKKVDKGWIKVTKGVGVPPSVIHGKPGLAG